MEGAHESVGLALPAAAFLAALAGSAAIWSFTRLSTLYRNVVSGRQIRRTRPRGLRPIFMHGVDSRLFGCALIALSGQPDLPADSNLFWRITQHAGGEIVPGISSHILVATHVFLETIHYAVWILLIPLVDWRALPWKVNEVPLFANKSGFPRMVTAVLGVSCL